MMMPSTPTCCRGLGEGRGPHGRKRIRITHQHERERRPASAAFTSSEDRRRLVPLTRAPARSSAGSSGPRPSDPRTARRSRSRRRPASAIASTRAAVVSRSGSPAVTKGMSARLAPRAQRRRNKLVDATHQWAFAGVALREQIAHLGRVLVAASRQVHDEQLGSRRQRRRQLAQNVRHGVGGLEGGDDALLLREVLTKASRASHRSWPTTYSARPTVAQVGVLGPHARVVEAGGDRMRRERSGHRRRTARSVRMPWKHARARPRSDGRAVASRLRGLSPPASTPIIRTLVLEERMEETDRVRASTDTGHQDVGQPALGLAGSARRASMPITRWKSRTSVG